MILLIRYLVAHPGFDLGGGGEVFKSDCYTRGPLSLQGYAYATP